MAYKSLHEFINVLENNNLLIRIKQFVDPVLEITEIADRFVKESNRTKALLFENTGTAFPLLINSMASDKLMCLSLGIANYDEIGNEFRTLFKQINSPASTFIEKLKLLPTLNKLASWMPKSVSGRGACQEIIMQDVNLELLPVLKCWPFDGARFFTLPVVNTKDPLTGIRNAGMYRMQVFSKNETGMHWHRHKVGARHYNEYKKLNKKMPVAVCLGGDPIYAYCATAPLPDNIDEYMLAGFLRKKKVELVKCLTQNIEVPADADIVIEGFIDTNEELRYEGPFGDHTGFYSLPDYYPVFHVTCITHRRDAVFPATIVGIPPMEDAFIAKATERIFIEPIKMTIAPELIDLNIPHCGVGHNITLVQIEKSYPGQGVKIMNALWGAGQMMFNKIMMVCSNVDNIFNYKQLAKTVSERFMPETDVFFSRGPLDVLDHAAQKLAFGGKMGFDFCEKLPEEIINTAYPNFVAESINDNFIEKLEIQNINYNLLKENIAVVFVSIHKKNVEQIISTAQNILKSNNFQAAKICVFVDFAVDVFDIETCLWLVANNIDPQRDAQILTIETEFGNTKHLIIDGTTKTQKTDNFRRQWPNVIVNSPEVISKIDANWESFGLGAFIASPSVKYSNLIFNEGAAITSINSEK